MGLTVTLETEDGKLLERAEDPTNILHRVLPKPDDKEYQYLGTIDWYGDTTFNYLQASRFLQEWHRMGSKATNPEDHDLIVKIERMAERLLKERHTYLKFYGD